MNYKYHNINTIANNFLHIMTENGISNFIKLCTSGEELSIRELGNTLSDLMDLDDKDLINKIKNMHNEHVHKCVQIALWKERYKKSSTHIREILFNNNEDFFEEEDTWLIDFYMVLNGHKEMYKEFFYHQYGRGYVTYQSQIELSLDYIYSKINNNDSDECWYSWLLRNSALLGLDVYKYERKEELFQAYDYIKTNIKSINMDINLNDFAAFMFIINDKSEEAWEGYKYLLYELDIGVKDYLSFILGINIFGNRAKVFLKEIHDFQEIDGYDNFEKIFINFNDS